MTPEVKTSRLSADGTGMVALFACVALAFAACGLWLPRSESVSLPTEPSVQRCSPLVAGR